MAHRIQEARYKNELDRFSAGLIRDYPVYPSTDSLFELAKSLIKGMTDKGSY